MKKSSLEEQSLQKDFLADASWRRKTYRDMDFIMSDEGRPIRVLSEMLAPGETYQKEEIYNTIVFFGSARSKGRAEVEQHITRLEKTAQNGDKAALRELKTAPMQLKLAKYYDDAVELARQLADWSQSIVQPEKRFTICSGGGPGMMEAANRGSEQANAPSIGLNITLPHEQNPNPYQTEHLSFEFHYFFMRKYWFANLARCLVVFPGGFGTMDELFEFLTLRQTGKIHLQMPIVLFGREFWEGFLDFKHLLKWQVISQKDLDLFTLHDDPTEAADYIKHCLTQEFL